MSSSENSLVVRRVFLDYFIIPIHVLFAASLYQETNCQLVVKRNLCQAISALVPFISTFLTKTLLFIHWAKTYEIVFIFFIPDYLFARVLNLMSFLLISSSIWPLINEHAILKGFIFLMWRYSFQIRIFFNFLLICGNLFMYLISYWFLNSILKFISLYWSAYFFLSAN